MIAYLKTLIEFYLLKLLSKSEKGQDMAEYALLIAFIAIVVIAAVVVLGTRISAAFQSVADTLP